jgi:hypothetical protein
MALVTFWRKIEQLKRFLPIRAVRGFCEPVRLGVPEHSW